MRNLQRVITGMTAMALCGLCTTPVSMADSSIVNSGIHPYPRMVTIGDSIGFGYNLSKLNTHPSRSAFPFLIGKDEKFQVRDISVPGWTSSDALKALQTNRYVRESVKYANVVVVEIGSNDILSLAVKDGLLSADNLNPTVTPAETHAFGVAVASFQANLVAIVRGIKSLSPNAKVVLYNIYNPIPSVAAGLHKLGEQWVGQENQVIDNVGGSYGIPIADAYGAFDGKQSTYVGFGDVHPTIQGQQALAAAGEAVLGS